MRPRQLRPARFRQHGLADLAEHLPHFHVRLRHVFQQGGCEGAVAPLPVRRDAAGAGGEGDVGADRAGLDTRQPPAGGGAGEAARDRVVAAGVHKGELQLRV